MKKKPLSKRVTRFDPSRTGNIRRRFERDVRARFKQLRKEIWDLIVTQNIFGLGQTNNSLWSLLNPVEAIRRFHDWIASRSSALILEETGVKDEHGKWIDGYVQSAYFKGADMAEEAVNATTKKATTPFSFLEPMRKYLQGPVNITKIRLIKERAFELLKGVTQKMAITIGNILSDGIVAGKSPRQVATDMVKEVDNMTKKQALTIARTETIRAHAEGSLDAMEQLGVKKIGVMVEWQATYIDEDAGIFEERVCPKCQAMAGIVLEIEKSHGLIPFHPNCRCTWVPNILGETPKDEVRSRVIKAIKASASKKKQSLSEDQLVKESNWAGANLIK